MHRFQTTLPVVILKMNDDCFYTFPLFDKKAYRVNSLPETTAREYQKLYQEKVINAGKISPLIWLAGVQDWQTSSVLIDITIPEIKPDNAPLQLEVVYFFQVFENHTHIFIPALAWEHAAENGTDIPETVREAVLIFISKNKYQHDLKQMLLAFMNEGVSLTNIRQIYESNTLSDAGPSEKHNQILSKTTHVLRVTEQQIIGRDQELNQLTKAMKGTFQQNVLLTGAPGIGKTALVWEQAYRMTSLGFNNQILETSASQLIQALTKEGQWQEKLSQLCRELSDSGDFLFVRNMAELFEIGQYEGNSESIAEYLLHYIVKGDIRIIGECTEAEFARIELRSPGYFRHFQVIKLSDFNPEMLEKVIVWKAEQLGRSHQITLTTEAAKEAIRLHNRFLPYSGMPGKIIRFIESLLLVSAGKGVTSITREDIIPAFCEESGMPRFLIDIHTPIDMEAIRHHFREHIFGQEDAVGRVVDMIATIKTALVKTGKPIASFLFAGPTGVGKTELAKVLAAFIFGNQERMVRFDMSEFSSSYAAMRLIGEHYSIDGVLTSAVRKAPFSLILFDEIEKSHPVFYDFLLQVLSEGRLTDAAGRPTNFCSTIIVMTSNIGAGKQINPVGWQSAPEAIQSEQHYSKAIQQFFRPELFNRIDQIVAFQPIQKTILQQIIQREISQIRQREGILHRKMTLHINENVIAYLAEQGFDQTYGARYLQRIIRQELLLPLSKVLNAQTPDEHLELTVKADENGLQIRAAVDLMSDDLMWETIDKISQSEFASHLRRQFSRFMEGDFYVQLKNEQYHLSYLMNKKSKVFYKDPAYSRQFALNHRIMSEIEAFAKEINDLEIELSLCAVAIKPYLTSYARQLDAWLAAFTERKKQWLSDLRPELNHCELLIFGPFEPWLMALYQSICNMKAYQFSKEIIWNIPVEETQKHPIEKIRTTGPFFTSPIESQAVTLPEPPSKTARYAGIRFLIRGNLANLFFENENGYHQYAENNDLWNWLVIIAGREAEFPANVLRMPPPKKGQIRRTAKYPDFEDSIYAIKKMLSPSDTTAALYEYLEADLNTKVNIELGMY